MSGNIWEWVNDWYNDYAADLKPIPSGLAAARKKYGEVVRGVPIFM